MQYSIKTLGLALLLAAGSTQAAVIYQTSAGYSGVDTDYRYVTGTSHASINLGFLGSSAQWAEATASNDSIHLQARNAIVDDAGSDVVPYWPFASGSITYTGIVFSDSSNPGAGGSTEVQVNYSISETETNDLMAQLFFGGSVINGYSVVRPVTSGSYASEIATVPLDVPLTLELRLSLFNTGGSDGMGNRTILTGDAWMSLADLPFSLAQGITVQSPDLGLDQNPPPSMAVPEPETPWLLAIGLVALFGMRRRACHPLRHRPGAARLPA